MTKVVIEKIKIHDPQISQIDKKLPNTDKASKNLVLLPTHPNLSTQDVDIIIKNVVLLKNYIVRTCS